MTALDLARLRATVACQVDNPAAIELAAAMIGRVPRRAQEEIVLARHPESPEPGDLGAVPSVLPDSALVALGLCLGLAWKDRDQHPFPGRPFTIGEVGVAARDLHISVAASRHVIGAMRHVLEQARFLATQDHEVYSLGPAVAKWSDADVEALKRNLDVLPAPERSST